MYMGQSVRLQGDKCRIHQNLMHCSSFNLPHCSDCSSHREHIQGFFYTKESQTFVKPSSFKSRTLKFPTKSIINAALSTNLLLFFYSLDMFAASNIVAATHPYANTFSNPLIRSSEGLAFKTSAFQYFNGSKIDLRPCGTPIYEANFAWASSFKMLICRLS